MASGYTERDNAWNDIIFKISTIQNQLLNLDRNKFKDDKSYGAALKRIGSTRLVAKDSDLQMVIDNFFAKQKVEGFANWNTDKTASNIMKSLLKASFEQNPKALQRLLATGNATLTHT